MKANWFKLTAVAISLTSLSILISGCRQPTTEPSVDSTTAVEQAADSHSHGGWWCPEHSIPEEVCSMCSAKAAEECKAKGDWCEEHNRAESQCFICDPARAEKFAKLYEAKFGEAPPNPDESVE